MDNHCHLQANLVFAFGVIATALEATHLLESHLESWHLHLDVTSIPTEGMVNGEGFQGKSRR